MEAIERVKIGIETLKRGGIVVLIDEEDRENEGDLVYAGVFSTPEKVNFLAKEGRGLICTALTPQIAHKLQLDLMVSENSSTYETAFTISVDAKECTTGISAFERDLTIRRLSDPTAKPDWFKKPGHIFPLIAKEGGVLVRTGHTEGSVDLCKLAGLYPVAVICEIMNPDGTMARREDLQRFARQHNLPVLYISDIVQYRLQFESLIEEIGREKVEIDGVRFEKVLFKDHLGREHTALINALHSTTNLKIFRVMSNVDFLLNPHFYRQYQKALEYIKFNSGIILFLNTPKGDGKELGIGSQILKKLGVEKIKLLDTPSDHLHGLGGFGLEIVGSERLE
jgi:3,4-dihydroxy 2-butanone 4-phosphate synthase/GTP cyclohydrolase II